MFDNSVLFRLFLRVAWKIKSKFDYINRNVSILIYYESSSKYELFMDGE
ncbi:protein of unknown function [Candidatus Nitrosocosmicus franklandus]|uniref:Uncharacterized protein n=1 Tax=Candidatus Nitrosocosmicus franklandianus TaxID=1798806 RepID=A0A484I9E9_9ARCH|nr:protein of unknown function [Candidatus Nitrosocosmicus franklandus]